MFEQQLLYLLYHINYYEMADRLSKYDFWLSSIISCTCWVSWPDAEFVVILSMSCLEQSKLFTFFQ